MSARTFAEVVDADAKHFLMALSVAKYASLGVPGKEGGSEEEERGRTVEGTTDFRGHGALVEAVTREEEAAAGGGRRTRTTWRKNTAWWWWW